MVENSCEDGTASPPAPKTRATRWLIWSGITSLALAAICFAVTIVGMVLTLNSIATSTATPKPSDLAEGISTASLPSIAVIPLVVLGIVLLVAGLMVRQPIDRS